VLVGVKKFDGMNTPLWEGRYFPSKVPPKLQIFRLLDAQRYSSIFRIVYKATEIWPTPLPFPPSCKNSSDLHQFQEQPLAKFGGIRTRPPRGNAPLDTAVLWTYMVVQKWHTPFTR